MKLKAENRINNPSSFVVLFTGLSGAGKSTLSNLVQLQLWEKGLTACALDGDVIRKGLSADLSFTLEDRYENLRRVAEVSKLMLQSGMLVLAAFIAPNATGRATIKNIVGSANYLEVFVDTPLEICERRDVKGLYKKARNGELQHFTGISQKYEAPTNPDVHIKDTMPLQMAAATVCEAIVNKRKQLESNAIHQLKLKNNEFSN